MDFRCGPRSSDLGHSLRTFRNLGQYPPVSVGWRQSSRPPTVVLAWTFGTSETLQVGARAEGRGNSGVIYMYRHQGYSASETEPRCWWRSGHCRLKLERVGSLQDLSLCGCWTERCVNLDTYFSEPLSSCTSQSLGASGSNHTLGRTHCVTSVNHTLQRHQGSNGRRYSTVAEMTIWNCILSLPRCPESVATSNGYQMGWCYLSLADKTQRFCLATVIEEPWYGSHEL